jgi:hypothetical protein
VNIYDFGQDTDGALFIAMELIDGRSLRSVLTEAGALPPTRALAIAAQLAASLADAHAHGIVHRDLKPDNAMLQDRGKERDVVRVLDFGIAKLRDDARTDQPTMTQAGDLLGTPLYMAPEQIRGDAIDGRTDVYALGCILYEMLTGRMPFEATTVMGLLSKHLTDEVVPPTKRRPDLALSPALDDLVLSAMNKHAAARPATMEAYGEKIMAVLGAYTPTTSAAMQPQPLPLPLSLPQPAFQAPTPMGMQMSHRPPPPAHSSTRVFAMVGAALACLGVIALVIHAGVKHGERRDLEELRDRPIVDEEPPPPAGNGWATANPKRLASPAYGIAESAATIDPPASNGWDTGPTDEMSIPETASIPVPRDTTMVDEGHYHDAGRSVDYLMLPLMGGTNDVGQLCRNWLLRHPELRLVHIGSLQSAGGMRTYGSFVGRGEDGAKVGQVAVLYIAPTYRVVVFVTAPPDLFSDASFAAEIDTFFATGVKIP